jgi:hypothetical protein
VAGARPRTQPRPLESSGERAAEETVAGSAGSRPPGLCDTPRSLPTALGGILRCALATLPPAQGRRAHQLEAGGRTAVVRPLDSRTDAVTQ